MKKIILLIFLTACTTQNASNEILDFNKNMTLDEFKVLKTNTLISTNDVINTNNCYLSVFKTRSKNKYIILSAIDNLIKGGAGQAIQNMNIKYGFAESRGLK